MDEDLSAIHRICSTAIPGLLVKPIVDILDEAKNIKDIDRYERAMKAIGFEFKGEFGILDHILKCLEFWIHFHYEPSRTVEPDFNELEKFGVLNANNYELVFPSTLTI